MLVSSIGYFNVAGVVSSDNNAQKNQSASRITSSEKFGQVHASEIISSTTKPNLLTNFVKSLGSLFFKNTNNESAKYLSLIG